MILSELRDYLRQKRRVALQDLMRHFDIEADALRGMLQQWIRKGKVRQIQPNSACGSSCCKCDASLIEFYEWLDDANA